MSDKDTLPDPNANIFWASATIVLTVNEIASSPPWIMRISTSILLFASLLALCANVMRVIRES
jgi:hypothetical protein